VAKPAERDAFAVAVAVAFAVAFADTTAGTGESGDIHSTHFARTLVTVADVTSTPFDKPQTQATTKRICSEVKVCS
jgi:hypothetical protein